MMMFKQQAACGKTEEHPSHTDEQGNWCTGKIQETLVFDSSGLFKVGATIGLIAVGVYFGGARGAKKAIQHNTTAVKHMHMTLDKIWDTINKELQGRHMDRQLITFCENNGHPFTYYPELGVKASAEVLDAFYKNK